MTNGIKQIVFDCDGVILQSTNIKTLAFEKTVAPYGLIAQKAFMAYHHDNYGISRMNKFEWFCKDVLKSEDDALPKILAENFAKIVQEEILICPFVDGVLDILEDLHKKIPLYVCSGTPQEELLDILQKRGVAKYFKEIYGTPPEKHTLLQELVRKSGIAPENTLMVGDAQTDLDAANYVGTQFYGIGRYFEKTEFPHSKTLTNFDTFLNLSQTEQEQFIPHILIVSSIANNTPAATGQLINKLFKNLPKHKELIFTKYKSHITFQVPQEEHYLEALATCQKFAPSLCYFYLIDDEKYLKFINFLIENLDVPYVVHIMDTTIIQNYTHAFYIINKIVKYADKCYAISEKMATHHEKLFNRTFSVLHNFITTAELQEFQKIDKIHKKKTFTLLYSGAITENTTKKALYKIAKQISLLPEEVRIELEIRTQPWFFYDTVVDDFAALDNVKVTCIRTSDSYYENLKNADALLITQNFSEEAINYLNFSLANKLSECLASNLPIIAFGPEQIYTFQLLKEFNAALNINIDSAEAVCQELLNLYNKKIDLAILQENAQKLLEKHFLESSIYTPFKKDIQALESTKKNKNIQERTAIILGNGPSLRSFDFKEKLKNFITFGMNAAYRYWDKINWYPDYYACLDLVVGLSHKEEIKRLIENSNEYGIKQFLLRDNLIQDLGEIKNQSKIVNFDEIRWKSKFMYGNAVTTGSNTATWAAELGFENIILLGIDSNYVEILPQASKQEEHQLLIEQTPKHNPNYFFDDYQQKGDKYQVPNPTSHSDPSRMIHRAVWRSVGHRFAKHNILVLNCSEISKIEDYHKMSFDKALDFITAFRKQKPFCIGTNLPDKYKFSEDNIIFQYFKDFAGTVIEVGTHFGSETARYLYRGWTVHGFEPDDNNRRKCIESTRKFQANFYLNDIAVSDKSNEICEFYTSEESTGISSLHPFHKTHSKKKTVQTITLKDYMEQNKLEHIELLRIDTEGYDLKVLQGFDFKKSKPQVILCEFEDNKTLSLGYSTKDMIEFLQQVGYTVYVSEWAPIYKYGVPHFFAQLFKAPGILLSPSSWGNLICFKDDPGEKEISKLIKRVLSYNTQKTKS